jgi:chloramphenicol O-acetyltransferase
MIKIDISNWKRKQTYLFYKDMDIPTYTMTFNLDVTSFVHHIKQNKTSFYFSFMHLVMKEMNKIENFKYRFIEDEPYLYETIHPSFTDLVKDTDQFKIVTVDLIEEIDQFIKHAREKSLAQGDQFIDFNEEVRQDLVYITTFPWAFYQSVTQATNIDSKDAIPRVIWGKYEEQNGCFIMPLSLTVHHAFVDGIHVGMLIENLQNSLKTY